MKKNQNIFVTITIAIVGLLFSGCSDLIDLEPNNEISESAAFSTESGLERSRNGMYTKLMDDDGWYMFNMTILPDCMGGNARFAPNAKTSRFSSETAINFNASSTNGDLWADAYIAVYMANNIIRNIDGVDDEVVSAAAKAQIKGEAYFMRALSHFDLVRTFAQAYNLPASDAAVAPGANGSGGHLGIPVIDENSSSDQPVRNTVAEVYAQIIADLLLAETLLVDDYYTAADDNVYFASRAAAQALLARAYLYQEDNANAAAYATTVIGNANYSLIAAGDFGTSWATETNSESIFSVQLYSASPEFPTDGETVPDVYNWDGTYADVSVSNDVYILYTAGDDRLDVFYNDPNDGAVVRMSKYPTLESNIPVIRLAEMYLTRAEANQKAGTSTGATPLADINVLRANRGLAALGAVDLTAVLLERRLELAFEGHHWFDITRNGLDLDRTDTNAIERADLTFPSVYFVLPIPEFELNANPNVEQNTGF